MQQLPIPDPSAEDKASSSTYFYFPRHSSERRKYILYFRTKLLLLSRSPRHDDMSYAVVPTLSRAAYDPTTVLRTVLRWPQSSDIWSEAAFGQNRVRDHSPPFR